jgi:hypothetical protein
MAPYTRQVHTEGGVCHRFFLLAVYIVRRWGLIAALGKQLYMLEEIKTRTN